MCHLGHRSIGYERYLTAQPSSVGLADVMNRLLGKLDHLGQIFLKEGQPITILGTLQFVFIGPITTETRASYFHC
jgi:hypothetical protein